MGMGGRYFTDSIFRLQQGQHRHNDNRAGRHADDLHHLLLPRGRTDDVPGFQILQIVAAHRRGATDDRPYQQSRSRTGRIALPKNPQQEQ